MLKKSRMVKLNYLAILVSLGIGFLLSTPSVGAANQALIDALVQNGVLKAAQAEKIAKESNGSDQALIDALLENGALTKAQAKALSKKPDDTEANAQATAPSEKADETTFDTRSNLVEGVEFIGELQMQYDNIAVYDKTTGVNNPSTVNSFILRNIKLGVEASLKNNWRGVLVARFNDNDADLDKAFIANGCDYGDLKVGLSKVNFGYEENTPSSEIKSLERSMVTRYFTESPNTRRVGLGGRHTGIFADGMWNNFGFGAAVTNGYHGGDDIESEDNDLLGFYGNLFYRQPFRGDNNALEAGFNFGFQPEGNTPNNTVLETEAAVIGYNPYLAVRFDRFRLVAEYFMANIEKGRQGTGDNADPWGINVIPSFKVTDQIELVFRYSQFDGDSRGMRISDGIRRANNPVGDPAYDQAQSYYFGFNWYIADDDVKLSAGYERADYSDRLDGSGAILSGGESANVNAIRARLQLLF